MSTPRRPGFATEAEIEAWMRQCNEQLATQQAEYACAPLCQIRRADGTVIGPGEAVTVRDFEPPLITPTETLRPHEQLHRAIRDGAVLVRGRRFPMQSTGGGPEAA